MSNKIPSNKYVNNYIKTYSHIFDYNNIESNTIMIEDVAVSLSNQCRYNGHLEGFYSVAEHSVLCAFEAYKREPDNLDLQWACLLHDASEAYLADIPSPLKAMLPDYKQIEHRVEEVIAKQYNINTDLKEKVKDIDIYLLGNELKFLGKIDGEPEVTIKCVEPWIARELFMTTYETLKTAREM